MIRLFIDGIFYSLAISVLWHFVLSAYTDNIVRVIGLIAIISMGVAYVLQLNAYWRDKKKNKK